MGNKRKENNTLQSISGIKADWKCSYSITGTSQTGWLLYRDPSLSLLFRVFIVRLEVYWSGMSSVDVAVDVALH